MIDSRAKRAARLIIRVHEVGSKKRGYGTVTVLKDGPGHVQQVTYGDFQSTDKSDSLDAVIHSYISRGGAQAARFAPFLKILALNTSQSCQALAASQPFRRALVDAGNEPEMRAAQDEIFDSLYAAPALAALDGSGWSSPLAFAVILDSFIQGSWARIRNRVPGSLAERPWIARYVAERRSWKERVGGLLENSTYRERTFEALIAADNWELVAPFAVRNVTITEADLNV